MRVVHILSLIALTGSLSAQIHVSPTGNDLGAGTPSDPFRTIDHAADVATVGTTIFLQAGVYGDEQGIVLLGSKDLVLQGAGTGATVLRPHSALTASLLPPVPLAATPSPHRVGVLIDGPARLHLRDLTIDAQSIAPPSGQVVGLYLRGGADVVCEQCEWLGCRGPTLGVGLSHAVALRGNVAIDPTTLVLRRSRIVDFGDVAVRAVLRAEVDVQECTIVGAGGTTLADQNGVLVETDAVGKVRLCRIVGCAGALGAAVRFENHSTGWLVEANRIARCAFGIDLRHLPASIVPGSVRNNRITAVDTTVRVRGVSGVFVTGNSLFATSRLAAAPFWDDTPGDNAWQANRFAVPPGVASVAIPGGGNVDSFPQPGISELRELTRVACAGAPVAVVAADFDGDGQEDFATLDLVGTGAGLTIALQRTGSHAIAAVPFGGSGLRPVALATGNFDGTPGVDLVALTSPTPPATSGAAFWIFANDGSGGMTLLHQQPLAGYLDPAAIAVAGLNGDGLDDLLLVDRGAPPLTAGRADRYLNSFNGVSWAVSPLPGAFTEPLVAVAAGDLDGDALVDVVALEGTPSGGRLHGWQGDGIGGLLPIAGLPLVVPDNPRDVAVADFDGDGDRDVLVLSSDGVLPLQHGAMQIFENQSGVLQPRPKMATDVGPQRIVTADFDADAFPALAGPDVLVLNTAAADLSLFGSYSKATGFTDGGLATLADGPADVAVTDLDGDSYLDVVIAEPARGGVALLHGSATARVRTLGRGCPGTSGREPWLEVTGSPGLAVQPNPTFSFTVVGGFPNSIAACAVALAPQPVLVPCQYLLDAPLFLLTALLDSQGSGVFFLPLPAIPDARGLQFCLQAGVFDFAATTSFLPFLSLTAAACLRVGD